MTGIRLRDGVCFREMFVLDVCTPQRGVSALERFRFGEVSVLEKCPAQRGVKLHNDIYFVVIPSISLQFLPLSTGAETGDYSLVETGDLPSPLDKLREQVHSNGHYCAKFFRLTTDGITICEDHRINRIVASTGKINPESTVRIYKILDTDILTTN